MLHLFIIFYRTDKDKTTYLVPEVLMKLVKIHIPQNARVYSLQWKIQQQSYHYYKHTMRPRTPHHFLVTSSLFSGGHKYKGERVTVNIA